MGIDPLTFKLELKNKENNNMTVVAGKAYWAKLDQAQNPFDESKPRWSLDVSLDANGVKAMKAEGLTIKDKQDDRGKFMTLYKDQFLRNGTELPKPRLMDSQKNDISGTIVGNGSDVRVSFTIREWKMNNKEGKRPVLKDVQVLKLVEYSPPDEFDVEEGYVGTSNDTANSASSTEDSDLEFD